MNQSQHNLNQGTTPYHIHVCILCTLYTNTYNVCSIYTFPEYNYNIVEYTKKHSPAPWCTPRSITCIYIPGVYQVMILYGYTTLGECMYVIVVCPRRWRLHLSFSCVRYEPRTLCTHIRDVCQYTPTKRTMYVCHPLRVMLYTMYPGSSGMLHLCFVC